MAWDDRPWVLDGADVRVSIVGFDQGLEPTRALNEVHVDAINADLTGAAAVSTALALTENMDLCFRCDEKGGPFEIDDATARRMLAAPTNANGRRNLDVVRPFVNARDIMQRPGSDWVIDFGPDVPCAEAAMYELPFEYVRETVKPVRETSRSQKERALWWLHRRPAPDMRRAVAELSRFIATPRVAKHRVFVFLDVTTLPDSRVAAIAREDDYFFGVLHSRIHEVWALATSSRHGVGDDPTYNSTTCFETFPFPWPPGKEPTSDPRVQAIAAAAKDLVEKRDRWLNPEGAGETDLKKRTLTNLYNQRPTWLDLAHERLDEVVLDAYAWPHDLTDDQILERLLALNLARAAGHVEE
jgi:hypothetical protein